MALPAHFRPLSARISLVVLFALSVVLTQVPLFNYLGYEFSAAIALALALLSGFATVGLFRSHFGKRPVVSGSDFKKFQEQNVLLHLVFLVTPLVVITLNTMVVRNCSFWEGLGFYLLLPGVTALFCLSLAGFCALVFRRPRTAYVILVAIIIGRILWLGYFTPQIFAYNLVLGYFPGLSYDEVLTISPTLILFRGLTLVAGVVLFLLGWITVRECRLSDGLSAKIVSIVSSFRRSWHPDHGALLISAMILAIVWIFRTDLGFESTNRRIERTLDGLFQTEHFRIHYSPDSFAGEDLRWVAAEHEFRFQQVARRLQTSSAKRIDSYIYPTAEMKREFIGTGTTNIAKPWRREIHLNKDSWRQTLKHELVHVLAGEFGMPVIRANYNVGLVEGLAMAVEWEYANRTLHEYVAAMAAFGLMKDMSKLLSLQGFALQAPSVSYVLSGSFCRFLIDRYGIMRFKELYGGKSFSSVYGKDPEALIGEWDDFLSRFSPPDTWKPHVKFLFNRKSIFARECARQVAKLNERAAKELGRRNPVEAMRLYGTSLRESWSSEAFAGLVRSAYVAARYDTVVDLIDHRLAQDSSALANLMILYGDALWVADDVLSARKAYRTTVDLDIFESFTEAAALRLSVLDDPALSLRLRKVFVGFESDSIKRVILREVGQRRNQAAVRVLLGQVLFRMKAYDDALNVLDGPPSRSADSTLDLARFRLMGVCAFQLRRFQQARAYFWQAMNFTTNEASRLRLDDWIDRCEWFDARGRRYLDSQE